jgi:hypothetical protein
MVSDSYAPRVRICYDSAGDRLRLSGYMPGLSIYMDWHPPICPISSGIQALDGKVSKVGIERKTPPLELKQQ